jgi:alginate O-acetyltransferase complex protein AlgI
MTAAPPMVFSSSYFLFCFLPVALLACLAWRGVAFRLAVFAVSLIFYFWSAGLHVFILVAIIGINFFGAALLGGKRVRGAFAALVLANLGFLFIFKYLNFTLANIDAVLHTDFNAGIGTVLLPAGISFFVFQGISYISDVRRGTIAPDRSFLLYGAYQSFFPHLIAGPIVRYSDLIGDFLAPRISAAHFADGVTRFSHGLFKKVIIADNVAPIADAVFALPAGDVDFIGGWSGALAYALQIYFDFSGYSDMAIGLALMFGIRFTENFTRPYASRSITEFWRRWHITLSSWFRDYVYIPLGGNRHGGWRTAGNLLIVFAATGIWHGAAWNFLGWGLYHGMFLVGERVTLGTRRMALDHPAWRYAYALPVIVAGWVLFRAGSIGQALAIWRAMAAPFAPGAVTDVWSAVPGLTPYSGCAFIAGSMIFLAPGRTSLGLRLMDAKAPWAQLAGGVYTVAALVVSSIIVLTGTYSPFLYFRF